MRRKGQRSVELDLTSFLDVLFVILIAYMLIFTGKKATSEQTPMPITPGPEDYITLSLEVFYDEENIENRAIIFKNAETDEFVSEFPDELTSENEDEEYILLKEAISNVVQENKGTPVLLCMYKDRILYRDHERLDEITNSIKEESGDLYPIWKSAEYAENILGEDDAE